MKNVLTSFHLFLCNRKVSIIIHCINMDIAFQSQLDYSSLLKTANFSATATLLSDWIELRKNIISRGKDSRKNKMKHVAKRI